MSVQICVDVTGGKSIYLRYKRLNFQDDGKFRWSYSFFRSILHLNVGMYEESGFLHPDEIKAKLMLFLNTP
jgi:hypothetical protein